jgi:hypothetical protein
MQCVWSTVFEQWKLSISIGEQWHINIKVSGSLPVGVLLIAEALLNRATREVVVPCSDLRINQRLADVEVDIGIDRVLVDSISAGILRAKSWNDEALARVFSKFLLLIKDLDSSECHGDSHSTSMKSRLNSWHWLRWR